MSSSDGSHLLHLGLVGWHLQLGKARRPRRLSHLPDEALEARRPRVNSEGVGDVLWDRKDTSRDTLLSSADPRRRSTRPRGSRSLRPLSDGRAARSLSHRERVSLPGCIAHRRSLSRFDPSAYKLYACHQASRKRRPHTYCCWLHWS